MGTKFTNEQKKVMYEARYVGRTIELIAPIDNKWSPKPIGARFHIESIDDMIDAHGYWLPPQSGSLAVCIEEVSQNRI